MGGKLRPVGKWVRLDGTKSRSADRPLGEQQCKLGGRLGEELVRDVGQDEELGLEDEELGLEDEELGAGRLLLKKYDR